MKLTLYFCSLLLLFLLFSGCVVSGRYGYGYPRSYGYYGYGHRSHGFYGHRNYGYRNYGHHYGHGRRW